MEYMVEKSADATLMVLKGELTIQHAEVLKAALAREMSDAESRLVVDLERVTEIDLSCLQLLCSARRTFLELNKHLSLSTDQETIFVRTVNDVGLVQILGCHEEPLRS